MKVKVECLFPARERLGTQANLVTAFVNAKKCFITFVPGANPIKLFNSSL